MSSYSFQMINQEFDSAQGLKVILSLVSYKLNYLNHEYFNKKARSGKANLASYEERIKQLTIQQNKLLHMLKSFKNSKNKVKVECNINLEL